MARESDLPDRQSHSLGSLAPFFALVAWARDRSERQRIRRHLETVEAELRKVDVYLQPADLQSARGKALDALHEYHVAGRFPRNTFVRDRRVPIIRDAEGTLCAVAHIAEKSGEAALVGALAGANNHVRIRDENDGPLLDWLGRTGLTRDEAARIQPSYDPVLDVQIFVIVLFATLLPVNLLLRRLFALFARSTRPRGVGVDLIRAGTGTMVSIGIAVAAVVAFSQTYGDPFALPFRTSLLLAFLLTLLPLELLSVWLVRSVFPDGGSKSVATESYLTLLNVAAASFVGFNLVGVFLRAIFGAPF